MSKNDYIHIPKWWVLRQIAWNKSVTDYLAVVLPRDPKGEVIPANDSPDCIKYYNGIELTQYAEEFLVTKIKQIDRREDDGQLLFNDIDRRES